MGVASLVLGLVSFFIAMVPLCGYIAFPPALIGLILGSIFLVQAKKTENSNTGSAIAGVVFNALALFILLAYTILFSVISGSKDTVKHLFEDAISDSARIEQDSVSHEIEEEFSKDSTATEPNPFDMGGTDAETKEESSPDQSEPSDTGSEQ